MLTATRHRRAVTSCWRGESAKDRVWGIGLAADDPAVVRRAEWPGKNWLGEALMRLRDTLRAPDPRG